jgi:hypothetical protein
MIILDTDIMIDLLRKHPPAIAWITSYSVVWPSSKTCDEALSAFNLYHLSHSLGLLDFLIGETALALNLPLHTFNQTHYAAIPNLKTVQLYTTSVQTKGTPQP